MIVTITELVVVDPNKVWATHASFWSANKTHSWQGRLVKKGQHPKIGDVIGKADIWSKDNPDGLWVPIYQCPLVNTLLTMRVVPKDKLRSLVKKADRQHK